MQAASNDVPGPRLRRLLGISSPALSVDTPGPSPGAQGYLAGQLSRMLAQVNGFYAFESALHVFPTGSCDRPGELALESWNDGRLWRDRYGSLADGHLFFAEDVFGGQFSLRGDAVCTFEPETGASEVIASHLEGWADALLTDHGVLAGSALAHAWQVRHGALPAGRRLVPRQPFVLGGEFTVDNLFAVEAVEGMRLRGELAHRLHDLPDGARVRYRAVDGE